MRDTDIHNNTFINVTDDAISIDGNGCNVRVYENEIYYANSAISVAPSIIGPTYIFRNVIYDPDPAFNYPVTGFLKTGEDGTGDVYLYHNTVVCGSLTGNDYTSAGNYGINAWGGGGVAYNIHTKNNIIIVNCPITATTTALPEEMDYDILYNVFTSTYRSYWAKYNNVNYGNSGLTNAQNFLAFQVGTGLEVHGSAIYPTFTDELNHDYTLTVGSSATDNGTELLGFNDANSPYPYDGSAPDIGAFEFNAGGATAPTVATLSVSLITATTARINGSLLATGGEVCSTWGYWDTVDGLDVPGDWTDNKSADYPAQPQGVGVFYLDITGLSESTLYYVNVSGNNSYGWDFGISVNFTTLSATAPDAPLDVSASDGLSTSNVTITWSASNNATGYIIFRDSVELIDTGNVTSYQDATASAASINSGYSVATDGDSTQNVSLSLSEYSLQVTTHTYSVKAYNASGNSSFSDSDTGYRGYGTPAYQWMVSADDSDAGYGNIAGATTENYTYANAPTGNITAGVTTASDNTSPSYVTLSIAGELANNGDGRYYKCTISADGCVSQNSTPNRGYVGIGALTLQWLRSAGDADIPALYSVIIGGTTDPYNDTDAPADGSGRYYKATLSADGAVSVNTTADRGFKSISTTGDAGKDIFKFVLPVVIAIIVVVAIIVGGFGISWASLILVIGGIIAYYIVKIIGDVLIH